MRSSSSIAVAIMVVCACNVMTVTARRLARANHGFGHQLLAVERMNTGQGLHSRFDVGKRALTTSHMSPLAFISNTPLEQRSNRYNCNNIWKQQCRFRRVVAKIVREQPTVVKDADTGEFFANPELYPNFESIGVTSATLLDRLSSPPLNLKHPSAVQAAAFDTISRGENAIIGAETGSGKTLTYLLPLVEDVLKKKRERKSMINDDSDGDTILDPGYEYARAVILVPNKELAHQAVRMAASICGGLDKCVIWGAEGVMAGATDFTSSDTDIPEEDIVRLAVFPGGLSAPQDFAPFRYASYAVSSQQRQPPPDLVFATPAALGPLALSPRNIELFADVATLVVDEADMLLDGGYVRQLNNVLMGFRRADRLVGRYNAESFNRKKSDEESDDVDDDEAEEWFEGQDREKEQKKTQHIFVAATLPDYGLRSVDAYLNKKFPGAVAITMAGMHNARHYGLENDSQTCWNEIVENKDRMKRLVDVLRLDRTEVGVDGRGLLGEKVMVFLNSVNDVDGATNGLRRAGINAVPYHAKIPLQERTSNLDKFRRYVAPESDDEEASNQGDTIPVLVCTDLAARGLDIPGVTAVVQLQFAGNVVSHLHRMGRCGRAGNRDGRGIVFYGPQEAELVAVVREAEKEQSRMELKQDVEEELEDDDNNEEAKGKVKKAFSRKRGFTKKRKKERREMQESD